MFKGLHLTLEAVPMKGHGTALFGRSTLWGGKGDLLEKAVLED